MRMVLNDVSYSYEVNGEGPKVLLLHGFTGSKSNWNEVTSILSERYTVITLDLIGHGETDSPNHADRYEIGNVCEDINLFLEKLKINSIHIIGYSMGGRLALAFSIAYPHLVASLILESSSPGIMSPEGRKERRITDEELATEIVSKGIEFFVNKWGNIPLFNSQKYLPIEKQESIRIQRLQNDPIGLANSLIGMGTGKQPSYWDRISNLGMPILFICGELDEKFCRISKEMQLLVKNGKVEKIFGVGHAIHVEEPETFGKIVLSFLHGLTK
jgi:2-succinyl-6-hydroxy-2,4-cyclohexadiene-1-carboxylate synthase